MSVYIASPRASLSLSIPRTWKENSLSAGHAKITIWVSSFWAGALLFEKSRKTERQQPVLEPSSQPERKHDVCLCVYVFIQLLAEPLMAAHEAAAATFYVYDLWHFTQISFHPWRIIASLLCPEGAALDGWLVGWQTFYIFAACVCNNDVRAG